MTEQDTTPVRDAKKSAPKREPTPLERAHYARARAQGFAAVWVGVKRDTLINYGPTAKFTPSKTSIRSYDRKLARLAGVPRKLGRRKQAKIEALNAELTQEAQNLGLYDAPEQDAAA